MEKNSDELRALTFDGGVTEETVNTWKAKHRKVVRIDVVDGEETHVGYFHRPNLETVKAITKIAKTDEVKAGEVMFDNCWLGGSEHMRTDAVLFMAAQKQLGVMVNACMSSIKNL